MREIGLFSFIPVAAWEKQQYQASCTVMLTGLTRDGTFLIETGKVTQALKNFRWNESPLFLLNKLDEIGRASPTALGRSCPRFGPKLPVAVGRRVKRTVLAPPKLRSRPAGVMSTYAGGEFSAPAAPAVFAG